VARPEPARPAARRLRVLCLSVYPPEGPSLRHRVCTYADEWRAAGVEVTLAPFLSARLYQRRRRFGAAATAYKAAALALCTLRLLARLTSVHRYDVVVIHREAFPLGGAQFERLVARLNPRVVYDLDDAIWAPMPLAVNQRARWWNPARVADTMAASRAVVVGNHFLRAYAERHNRRVAVIPTPYADLGGPAGAAADGPPVIVWIGNVGNEEYLDMLRAPLARLAAEMPFVLRVIGSEDVARIAMPGVPIQALVWSQAREAEWLRSAAIGVMPLADREYERGKCAFKIVQYFSAGLPVVASPVGMNAEVVREGHNGYLVRTGDEWYAALRRLLADAGLRRRLGANGYATYRERFTVAANGRAWLAVLDEVAAASAWSAAPRRP
jgi:glycosyltransferase involved in cell wall biosynthesis